jgi:hypothetical protein
MGKNRTTTNDKTKIINSVSRTIDRKIHAEKRLEERFGIEYIKISKIIKKNKYKILYREGQKKVCNFDYLGQDIYFISMYGEIKTFLTKEMVAKSYPQIFNPPRKKKKKKKKKAQKSKKKVNVFIPASQLFGDKG